jgi:hypothetical protein
MDAFKSSCDNEADFELHGLQMWPGQTCNIPGTEELNREFIRSTEYDLEYKQFSGRIDSDKFLLYTVIKSGFSSINRK